MAAEPAWPVSPRADAIAAALVMGLGAAIMALSWRMDRLEQQGAAVFSAPGLWPGVVGLVIAALGAVLVVRARFRARRGGWDAVAAETAERVPAAQFALAVALFLVYALALVGHGLPFWLGTAVFVAAFVFLFQRVAGRATDARAVTFALVCGAVTALVVTVAFERLFFVRLP